MLDQPLPSPRTFELGLTLSGAVSAGAYTAGVLDEIFEALDEWDTERRIRSDVPDHRVELRVMAGASAGGMCAAIASATLGRPVPTNSESSALRKAWVERIDIQQLLTVDERPKDQTIPSVLDARILDEIAEEAVFGSRSATATGRGWLGNSLHLAFTVTNLRGVREKLGFEKGGHPFRRHRDVLRFCIGGRDAELRHPSELRLDWQPTPGTGWRELISAALATGAFPVGLATRPVVPSVRDLGELHCLGSNSFYWQAAARAANDRSFWAADGGVLNNEPHELCRQLLAGIGRSNERDGQKAQRATIMIDPFVDDEGDTFGDTEGPPHWFTDVGARVLAALLADARSDHRAILLANLETVASRYLISPTRPGRPPGNRSIASGAIGGFSGFLAQRYREHDYQLGRRNAQRFLAEHFTLPANNPLFDGARSEKYARHVKVGPEGNYLPIIPRFPAEGRLPHALPEWPGADDWSRRGLESRLEKRLAFVAGGTIEHAGWRVVGRASRLVLPLVFPIASRKLRAALDDHFR